MVYLANWDWISFCASNAYIDSSLSHKQDGQLEYPSFNCLSGERYHVRIWDMGTSANWGWWAVGGVHLEQWDGSALTHVIVNDGWERAEQKLLSDWQAILPSRNASRTWIDNAVNCPPCLQGSANDGWAAFLEVPPFPSSFQGSGSGGGSPYVAPYDGSNFFLDNNLLAFEEGMLGVDPQGVEGIDHYKMQKALAQQSGKYKLLLTEFETEHTYFDRVRLVAVDHSSNIQTALTPSGAIRTYTDPKPPITAVDNTGNDQRPALMTSDGIFYQGNTSAWVEVDFGPLNMTDGARLLLRSDPPPGCCYKLSILVQVRDGAGTWQNATLVVPRQFWSTDAVDLNHWLPDPFGQFKVRLLFTKPHKVDLVAIDTSVQVPLTTLEGDLVGAVHSVKGNVKTELATSNNVYADILPGESIELSFRIGARQGTIREFILVVEGRVIPAG